MINPGTYRARAMGSSKPHIQFGMAGTGTQQVAVAFMIYQEVLDDHRQPTGTYEPTGEEITWIGSFTPATMQRTCESLRYAGWSTNDLDDMTGLGSTDVDIVVEHEEYQGNTRAKVQWVNKPGSSKFKFKGDIPAGDFVDLKRRVKAMMLTAQQGTGRSAASTTRPPGRQPAANTGAWDGQGADPSDDGRAPDDLPF